MNQEVDPNMFRSDVRPDIEEEPESKVPPPNKLWVTSHFYCGETIVEADDIRDARRRMTKQWKPRFGRHSLQLKEITNVSDLPESEQERIVTKVEMAMR